MKLICVGLLCTITFFISAMEEEAPNKWEKKALSIHKELIARDKEMRQQFSQSKNVYRGALYQKRCQSLEEHKQRAKELKKNVLSDEYKVYKAYYRSCPNRGASYPMFPGEQWRDCPSCYSIFKEVSTATQEYLLQKKVIYQAVWNMHVAYGDKIKRSNYYFDVDNPENDLINFKLCYHGLKECEKENLETKK